MKQKPDETPDEWVRHMLDRLPDAPPPGSSFDSARLWNQLRPEIQSKPSRQRAWWWLAAACLAGLLLGWQVWTLSNSELKTSPATATYHPQTDTLAGFTPKSIEEAVPPAPAVAKTHQPKRQRNTTPPQRLSRPDNVAVTPELLQLAPVAQSTEPAVTSIVASVAAPRKANVAAVMPKRRFRVMHENELRAEDEAAPKIYPTNHFVRLGSGSTNTEQRTNNTPDNSPPTLVMPLTSHPNQ